MRLAAKQIETRPVWKPLHVQPIFADCEYIGGQVAESLFQRGLCLPSGSNLEATDLARVVNEIIKIHLQA